MSRMPGWDGKKENLNNANNKFMKILSAGEFQLGRLVAMERCLNSAW